MKKYLTFLNEMTFNQIPTQFQMFSKSSIILGYKDYKFDFTSNKGTNYSVYITMTKEKNETKMFDGTLLPNVIIPTIYFSETKYGLDPIYFNKLTNKNEFAEVIGKVIYIILDFVKNNTEYEVYSIGEVSDKKELFYDHWKYHFKNFDIKIGPTINYMNNNMFTTCYYLIKK